MPNGTAKRTLIADDSRACECSVEQKFSASEKRTLRTRGTEGRSRRDLPFLFVVTNCIVCYRNIPGVGGIAIGRYADGRHEVAVGCAQVHVSRLHVCAS